MWRYKKYQVSYGGAYAVSDYKELDELGEQGWEAYYVKVTEDYETYYLKKDIRPNR